MATIQALPVAYRVRRGWYAAALVHAYTATYGGNTLRFVGYVLVEYDDGTDDIINLGEVAIGVGFTRTVADRAFAQNGYVVGFGAAETTGASIPPHGVYVQAGFWNNDNLDIPYGFFAAGYLAAVRNPTFGWDERDDEWATWVFQGTVAEDATAGTHVCTLTVVPGAGNEMMVNNGVIIEGNTVTAQSAVVLVDDGTNALGSYIFNTDTAASISHQFPTNTIPASNASNGMTGTFPARISGTMRLVLKVTTAAVSVTQTFAVVCQIRGAVPTATLADTVGTPTLTTNTSTVF